MRRIALHASFSARIHGAIGVITLAMAFGLSASPAASFTWGWSANGVGSSETLFDNSAEPCPSTLPDIPPTAFKFNDKDGHPRVQVNIGDGSFKNRRLLGDSLTSQLRMEASWYEAVPVEQKAQYRPCFSASTYESHQDQSESSFMNYEWVSSPYLEGEADETPKLRALAHNEFRGNLVGRCTHLVPELNCWMASVTLLTAPDNPPIDSQIRDRVGAVYQNPPDTQPGSSDYLVATSPYKYCDDFGRVGPHHLTNVIKVWENGVSAYYFLAVVNGPNLDCGPPVTTIPAQDRVSDLCLFRAENLADPASWRAWGGAAFDVTMPSPYESQLNPEEHRCRASIGPVGAPWNITYNTYLRKFMMIAWVGLPGGAQGITYQLSDDLHNWSDAQLLVSPQQGNGTCEGKMPYTTLLDPTDPAAAANPTQPDTEQSPNNLNFDHPGRKPQLWFVRQNQQPDGTACTTDVADADLVRIPIEFQQKVATFEGVTGGVDNAERGFTSHAGTVNLASGSDYDGSGNYADAASTGATSSWAYGRTAVKWNDGDDVWYGGAYLIPQGFAAAATSQIDILNWKSSTDQGGITINANNKYQLMRQSASGRTLYGPEFELPTQRWVWLEVHQRLGSTGALSEVYVDGRPVSSSTDANRGTAAEITMARHGIVNILSAGGAISSVKIDRASVMGGETGGMIGTSAYRAPKTPLGIRKVLDLNDHIYLSWNYPRAGEPPVTGYRVYKQQTNGTWTLLAEPTTPIFVEPVPVGSCGHRYRVTAVRSATDALGNPAGTNISESIYSTPITVRPCPSP